MSCRHWCPGRGPTLPGIFAPNSRYRGRVTKARRGRGGRPTRTSDSKDEPTPSERRAAMTWTQRLKRVFGIHIETCRVCGGAVRIIASIEDPKAIAKIRSLGACPSNPR